MSGERKQAAGASNSHTASGVVARRLLWSLLAASIGRAAEQGYQPLLNPCSRSNLQQLKPLSQRACCMGGAGSASCSADQARYSPCARFVAQRSMVHDAWSAPSCALHRVLYIDVRYVAYLPGRRERQRDESRLDARVRHCSFYYVGLTKSNKTINKKNQGAFT